MNITKDMIKEEILTEPDYKFRYCVRKHGWFNNKDAPSGHYDLQVDIMDSIHQFMFRKHPLEIGNSLTKVFYRPSLDMANFGSEILSDKKDDLLVVMMEQGEVEMLSVKMKTSPNQTKFILKFNGEYLCGTYIIDRFENQWGIYKKPDEE
jgi:hypothetical protein